MCGEGYDILKSHLGKGCRTGEYDEEKIGGGEVKQEPVGEVASDDDDE